MRAVSRKLERCLSPRLPRRGFLHRVAKWLEGPDEIRVGNAKKILDSIENHAKSNFKVGCGVNQEKFRPQFGLEMLHLWALKIVMVPADPDEGPKHFAEVCEQVWARTEVRIYKEGIHSFLISKNLKEIQQWTFGAMTAYDKGIIEMQATGDNKEFVGSLWRNIYDCDVEISPAQAVTLADHILTQIQDLQGQDKAETNSLTLTLFL
ncbi:hypothetical protein AAMO2058_000389700 [Amorphochlora amoebiformis]